MTYAQRLHLRLFIEGVEIPVVSASVNSQPDTPASCSIQIPFNDYALEFKPRTLVHLFFYDFYRGTPPAERNFVGGEGITVQQRRDVDPELESVLSELRINEATSEQIQTDLENENYKLLFGGEIVGTQVSKTPTQRAVVLQCMDWSSYWDYSYQYQVSGFSFGGGGIRAAFTGAATSVFNDFLEGSGDIVMRLMDTPPRSYPRMQGTLLSALMHIIEAIGGTYYGRNAVRGVNDFFSLAEMRLHLTQMVGANPFSSRDERRLMRAHGFGSLFRRALSRLGKQVSIRDILNALKKYIFHDIVPITTPHYVPPLTDPALPQFEEVGISEDDETRPIARAATQLKSRALELKQRQENSTSVAAARRQSRRRGGLERELRQLQRIASRAEQRARELSVASSSSEGFDRLFRLPNVSPAFAAAAQAYLSLRDVTTQARGNQFYLANTRQSQQVRRFCDAIVQRMNEVLASRHRRRINRGTSQPDPPPRLITQVWRPDVWMIAPPRSNVIFPELYSSFTYARNYMQETTRLMLRVHDAFFGSDILFDGFYMAPSRLLGARSGRTPGQGRVGVEPTDLIDAPAHFIRDLMDHELYTGIIPKFERMSDLNLHAIRGGSTEINGVQVGYAQLAANHIFFKQRFQSRQLSVQGKFNPWFILGFPAVIIDRRYTQEDFGADAYDNQAAARIAEAVAEGEGEVDGLPDEQAQEMRELAQQRIQEISDAILEPREMTHYLGNAMSLAHSVSTQGGGSTAVQLGYARTTNERTEFLGDSRALGRQSRFRRARNQSVTSTVAWTSQPAIGDRGPRGGEITEVSDVTGEYWRRQSARPAGRRGVTNTGQRRLRYAQGTQLPLWVPGGQINGRRYRGTRVLVGVEQAAQAYGAEVAALVGSIGSQQSGFVTRDDGTRTEITVAFNAYRVTETIGVYERTFQNLPPEELVFPPWYGEHWRSARVGGIYSFLFGTGSVVDPVTFQAPAGADTSMLSDPETSDADSRRGDTEGLVDPNFDAPAVGHADHPATGGQQYGPPGEPEEGDPVTGQTIGQVDGRGSINEAIETLVRTYSRVRFERWDTNEFLRSYTWRPIASLVDLFGTANLEINNDGEVVRGTEGFHSRAFGDFDDLRQLVRNVEGRPSRILGLTTQDPDDPRTADQDQAARDAQVAARMDTRREKRVQVLRYLRALLASRGVLG